MADALDNGRLLSRAIKKQIVPSQGLAMPMAMWAWFRISKLSEGF